jgi:signal transduction histidine kinase
MPISQRLFAHANLALLALGFLILLAIGGAQFWLVQQNRERFIWVNHTQRVETLIADLLTSVEDAETGQRGFLLTQNPDYLDRYDQGRRALPERQSELRALTEDNLAQRERLDRLSSLLGQKMVELADTITLARAGQLDQALALVRTDVGRNQMLGIRAVLLDMRNEERRLSDIRTDALTTSERTLLVVSMGGAVLILVLGGLSMWIVRRYTGALVAAQAALRALNAGLEQTVAERTAFLRAANDEIQRFAYIVSHDLRSPLVNIMGFTSELEGALKTIQDFLAKVDAETMTSDGRSARAAVDDEIPEALRFIRSSTEKMDRQINAILKLSREGRRVFQSDRIAMTPLLQTIADGLRHQTDEIGAEIRIERLPDLIGDRMGIEQVFGNLLDNAVKYLNPARKGRIVVRSRDLGGSINFEIEDNGRGIDPKDHERIFELFRRSGAQDRPGEGIGLAHVRAMVRRLGGTIDCLSSLDRGSTFHVTLPKVFADSLEGAR